MTFQPTEPTKCQEGILTYPKGQPAVVIQCKRSKLENSKYCKLHGGLNRYTKDETYPCGCQIKDGLVVACEKHKGVVKV